MAYRKDQIKELRDRREEGVRDNWLLENNWRFEILMSNSCNYQENSIVRSSSASNNTAYWYNR